MEKREYDPEIYDWEAQTEFELNDSGKRERFTTAYVRLLDDETLSDGAKILLLRLLAFQGTNSKAFPSLKKLCEVTGKGRTTIKRLLNELRECGWVLTKERFRPDNNGQSSNLFLLRDFAPHPEWVKSYKNSNAPVENSISAGGTPGPKMDRGVENPSSDHRSKNGPGAKFGPGGRSKNGPPITSNNFTNIIPSHQLTIEDRTEEQSTVGGTVISKGFEELWNIVKKKYAQTNTKKKAFEIYQTLITEGIEHSVLFRALIAYNEEFEANGYDTRYYVSLHRFLDRDEVYGWYDEQEKYLRTQMARETHRTIAKEERIKQEKLDAEQRRIDALCEVDPEAKHLHDLTFAPGQTMTERSQARSVWLDYLHKHLTEKERVVA